MFKKTLIALAIVAAASAPALAATTDGVFSSATTTDQLDFAKSSVLHQLQDKGVNATDVDSWGQYIKADVTLADGTQAVRFYSPDTLQQVNINHLN